MELVAIGLIAASQDVPRLVNATVEQHAADLKKCLLISAETSEAVNTELHGKDVI